jgi:hypothetical protein
MALRLRASSAGPSERTSASRIDDPLQPVRVSPQPSACTDQLIDRLM